MRYLNTRYLPQSVAVSGQTNAAQFALTRENYFANASTKPGLNYKPQGYADAVNQVGMIHPRAPGSPVINPAYFLGVVHSPIL